MPGLTLRGFLYELQMQGLPTAASDGSAWDGEEGSYWPTPDVPTGGQGLRSGTVMVGRTAYSPDGTKVQVKLHHAVQTWPTPMMADGEKHSPAVRMAGGNHTLTSAAVTQPWATPTVNGNGNFVGSSQKAGDGLQTQASAWATPASRDFRHPNAKSYAERGGGSKGEQLPNQVHGALNPAWVEILMGWPIGWTDPVNPCPGIWPGWPMGMGAEQHDYEPPRIATKGSVPHRVARVKACGNGVVPQQASLAFTLLLAPALPFLRLEP